MHRGQLEMQHSADYKYLDNANGQNSSSSIRRVWLCCSVTVCLSVSASVSVSDSVSVFVSLSVCAWQLLLLFSHCFHSQLERKKRGKKQTTQKLRLCHEFFGVCLVSPPRSPRSVSSLGICLPIYIDNNKYVKHSRSHVCLKLSLPSYFFFC